MGGGGGGGGGLVHVRVLYGTRYTYTFNKCMNVSFKSPARRPSLFKPRSYSSLIKSALFSTMPEE